MKPWRMQNRMPIKPSSIAKFSLLVLIVSTMIANCNLHKEISLNEKDNQRIIRIRKGQVLTISLKANPTTGFTWEVAEPKDEKVLRRLDVLEFRPKSSLVGAAGTMIIRFEGIHPGKTDLRLVYQRPWEKKEPLDVFSIRVIVK